ncbi:CBN-KIN-21 protein [Caenorhabditis brenneri]|uniref:Tyrosine-protein kinase n=1 Tax=Caenorhabditis brenneri TaxID=135651 RepID=G0MCH1_CAEBE|nr:CBN-KIN-21 protein [Caenorhabditis brenneri]
MPKKDQNSCQTAEAIIGKRESNTNLNVDGLIPIDGAGGTAEGGNTTDLERSGSFPDLQHNGLVTSDDEYVRNWLLQYAWYHGVMFGRVAEKLLIWENAWLVRRCVLKSSRFLCVSANVDGKVTHFPLNVNVEGWCCARLLEKYPQLTGKRFPHIWQLLDAWSLCTNYIVPVPRPSTVLMHSAITLENALGRGSFGEVFKAKYMAKGATEAIEVAAKRLIGDAKRPQLQDFCNEASVMALLDHRNVVAFYGFAPLQTPLILVMELVPGGDLKKYLKNTPGIPNKQIVLFALDISSGMNHLASRKVIHRDLAARNCLITKDLRVKISDFGLSVNETEVTVKNLRKAPIRWLAPETLTKGIFNQKTDVWAYGVLVTELMIRCAHDPLHPRDLKNVAKWIKDSDHPHRIEDGEPRELAEIVDACCEKSISSRLDFQAVKKRVAKIHQKMADLELAHALSPNPNPATNIEKKKSEDRKSNTDRRSNTSTDRRASNTTLTRKKSRDQTKRKERTNERKSKGSSGGMPGDKGKVKLVSNRRKEKNQPMQVPAGMSPNPSAR